jgi:hypothetical protein
MESYQNTFVLIILALGMFLAFKSGLKNSSKESSLEAGSAPASPSAQGALSLPSYRLPDAHFTPRNDDEKSER